MQLSQNFAFNKVTFDLMKKCKTNEETIKGQLKFWKK